MTDEVYRAAFEQAKKDLAKAMVRKQRAQTEATEAQAESIELPSHGDRAGSTVRRERRGLDGTDGGDPHDCRQRPGAGLVHPPEYFKLQVEQIGVSLDDLKNPDASVLSVLGRLVATNELATKVVKMGTPQTDTRAWRKGTGAEKVVEPEPELADDDVPF